MKYLYIVLGIVLALSTTAYAAATLQVYQGGTGTSTAPTVGQILIGNSSGGYNYIASSTLGSGGGGAVSSVFTRTGAVTAQSGDYTTAQVTESGNLYFTNVRAQNAITLTTTGTSGAASYSGGTLNIPNYANTTYTAGTGLTLTGGAFSVNNSQSISTLSNLTGNGFVKTTGGTGALSIDTNTYLTGNQSITLSGDVTGSGATAITTTLKNTGPGAGSFTNANITIDAQGRVTAASNGSTGTGSVTSVSATTPTGLTVSGSPITTTGTLAFSLTAGYTIPLIASTTQWASAYASTTALNGTAPITYNGTTGSIGCNVASGSQAGCLSSADWTTFNGKQPAGSYVTTGTASTSFVTYPYASSTYVTQGTASTSLSTYAYGSSTYYFATNPSGYTSSSGGTLGKVTRWLSSTVLGIGKLFDDGTEVGVNATSSNYTFNVQANPGQNPFNVASSSGSTLGNIDNGGNLTLAGSITIPSQINFNSTVYTQFQGLYSNLDFQVLDLNTVGQNHIVFTAGGKDILTVAPEGLKLQGGVTTMGTCGTSPSVSGNDNTGKVTVGSGVVMACTVNFGTTKTGTPHVFITVDGTTAIADSVSSVSTSGFTANFAATLGGGTFDYFVVSN